MNRIPFKRFTMLVITLLVITAGAFAKPKEPKRPDSYNYQRGIEAANDYDYELALSYFQKELEEHPDNGYALSWMGGILLSDEKYGEALTALNKSIKLLPKKDPECLATTYFLRAKLYEQIEDTTRCLEDLASAIKLQPDNSEYYSYRGQLLFERKQYDLADADYREIVRLEPGGVMGNMGLGRNLIAREQWQQAIEIFDLVARMHKDYSDVYAFRAQAHQGLKNWKACTDDLIQALDIDDNSRAFGQMISLPKEVIPMMVIRLKGKAVEQPTLATWPYYSGILLRQNRQFDEAVKAFEKAVDIDHDPTLLSQLAITYESAGNYTQALNYIDQAIEMDSTEYAYLRKKAQIQQNAGLSQEAIATMNTIIAQNPSAYAYTERGWIYEFADNLQAALDDYEAALMLDNEVAGYYINHGRVLYKLNRASEAQSDFEQTLRLDTVIEPSSVAPFALFYLGRYDEAYTKMNEIIASCKDDEDRQDAMYNAACIYSLLGRKTEAIDAMRTTLELGYTNFQHIDTDIDLDNVRHEPAFVELIKQYRKAPVSDNTQPTKVETAVTEVPFTRESGVCKVKCAINDLPLQFIFDTGASSVCISSVEASFMLKNGYLTKNDIRGSQHYITATGEVAVGTVVTLKKVQVGDAVLHNVQATVTNSSSAPLLLGQSAFQKLGNVELDNNKRVLRLTYKKPQ